MTEAALDYAAEWVDVPSGKSHVHSRQWPDESLDDWHRRHHLLGGGPALRKKTARKPKPKDNVPG